MHLQLPRRTAKGMQSKWHLQPPRGSIEPFIVKSPTEMATWGSLLLTAASADASAGDAALAWQLYGEASAAARMLGHDHADVHTYYAITSEISQNVSGILLGRCRLPWPPAGAWRQAPDHDSDHGPADHGFGVLG
jgi:hypothetical protein